MSTFARSGSQDRIWQTGGPRQAHGMMQITQQSSQYLHLQQQNQTGTKAFSSHSHQPSLNTELRAQVRREREATKKESKDMLLSGQTGRERSSSILSNQQHREEKRVSPKGAAKLTSGGDHRAPSQLNAPRHAHKTSTSAGSEYNSQIHRPLVQQAPALLERQSFDDVGSQRQPFGDLASRIPSPPKGDDTRDVDSMQTAYFVKYYYDIVEKCHSWQRYASNLKTKADTLELENRILRDINEEQDRDIRQLRTELSSMKQASMVHEHERRRAESKQLSPVDSSGDLSSRYIRQVSSKTTLQVEASMEPITIPSPPSSNRLLDARPPGSTTHPFCSSNLNLLGSDTGELTRPPTPNSVISLPQSLQAVLQGEGDGPYSRTARHRNESSANDAFAQYHVIKPEHTKNISYEYDYLRDIQKQMLPQVGSYVMTASNTFPPAGNTPSAALTVQALAAMNRQVEDRNLQSSTSVPQLPSQVWERPASPDRTAKRQISAGDGDLIAPRQKTASRSDEEADKENVNITHLTLPGYNLEPGNISGKAGSRAASSGDTIGHSMVRGGSAQSDAATVTGDYLQDIVDQRRRLRKVSHSQQQQLQLLQARTHLQSNASQVSLNSATGGGPGSRPSSRLSNYGGMRGKTRSRAGSYSLHDAIPVAKDDVFGSSSDAQPMAPIKRAGTMPLASLDVNIHGGQSKTVDEWMTKESQLVKEKLVHSQPVQELDVVDNDPKGAHRRLYIRLRDELETADLVRFERYVHRYDALEIGVDGSRGIINRVRRLLLPEELVNSKLALPDKYRLRKELAREFERIVREDAIPKEGESQEIANRSDNARRNESFI